MRVLSISKIPRLKTQKWQCSGKKLNDIDNNLTATYFSRRNIIQAWDTRGHFREGKTMHLLRIFHIPRLKTRLWNIAKCYTMQWKKTTWYRQRYQIHAIFTLKYFPRVRHPEGHFWEGKTMHQLRISRIPRLKARQLHVAKCETMQRKKTTWYRQKSQSHALFI